MFSTTPLMILFALAFLLGLRHGIDWDHLAAISDIVGTSSNRKNSFFLGSLYVLGHATVVIVLGLTAVLIGLTLPSWVDKVMQPLVGITLILLGLWLITSIIRDGKNYRLKSRWMLIIAAVSKLFAFIEEKISDKHSHPHIGLNQTYGPKTAFTIGVIHGVGAETPTQVLLFVAASGNRGSLVGSGLVLAFVAGLIISNSVITLASIAGIASAQKNSSVLVGLGILTAVFSLIVGTLFLLGRTTFLPAFFGG